MPRYAHYDASDSQPTRVIGWYDTDFADYPDLPDAKDLLVLTDKMWERRFDDTYIKDGDLVPAPAPSDESILISSKRIKITEIEAERDKAISKPVILDGVSYDMSEVSQRHISVILAGGLQSVVWRDADNVSRILTRDELKLLADEMARQIVRAYERSFELKNRVSKATSLEELEAIFLNK